MFRINIFKAEIIWNLLNILFNIQVLYLLYLRKGFLFFIYESIKYLTRWNYLFIVIYSILKYSKFFIEFKNWLYNIIFNWGFFTCIFFWVIIFPNINNNLEKLNILDDILINYLLHIYPILYVLIEILINNKIIIKWRNLYIIYLIMLLYFLCNLIYCFFFNDIPYNILNYNDITSLYILLGSLVFVFLINNILKIIIYFKFKLKIKFN